MSESIKALMKTFISQDIIFCSWGCRQFVYTDTKLSFSVEGLKYTGKIDIKVRTEYRYDIYFNDVVIEDVELFDVVGAIDNYVEVSDNYIDDLINYICKQFT